jgi:hypothetical protein
VKYLHGFGTLELDDDCFAKTDRTTLTAYRSIEESTNVTFSVLLAIEIALVQDDLNEGLRNEMAMSPHVLYFQFSFFVSKR